MDVKEFRRVAAFLREHLKQDKDAITVVMTREMILSLYTLAEKLASKEE